MKEHKKFASYIKMSAICGFFIIAGCFAVVETENRWTAGAPVLCPGPKGTFDEVAVKDPTIVFAEGAWHVFYTARNDKEYCTAYVSAPRLEDLQQSPRRRVEAARGEKAYGAAPQVFYFAPQKKWYLLFQTFDANYQPTFCTTATISDPESWSRPRPLLTKDEKDKWIDFWIICDESKAYLFYTRNHREVMFRTTTLDAFPHGWSEAKKAIEGIHEAVHIYKASGCDEYHMIYESNQRGVRSFGLAVAGQLAGPWRKTTDAYAAGSQLRFDNPDQPWTDMVSHGEIIRSGFDQRMEYDPVNCRWLIQGLLIKDSKIKYELLPWKLGVITLTRPDNEKLK